MKQDGTSSTFLAKVCLVRYKKISVVSLGVPINVCVCVCDNGMVCVGHKTLRRIIVSTELDYCYTVGSCSISPTLIKPRGVKEIE